MSLKLKLKVKTEFVKISTKDKHTIIEIESGSDEISVLLSGERLNINTTRGLRAYYDDKSNKIKTGIN